MDFKYWLEGLERTDRERVRQATIQAVKTYAHVPKDMADDEVLEKVSLKPLAPRKRWLILVNSNVNNLVDDKRLEEINDKIDNDDTAEYFVQDLIQDLMTPGGREPLNADKKTLPPKTPKPPQNSPQTPAPQAGPPPPGPQAQAPAPSPATPPQSLS